MLLPKKIIFEDEIPRYCRFCQKEISFKTYTEYNKCCSPFCKNKNRLSLVRKYQKRPEIKEYRKKHNKEYRKRPEIKKRNKKRHKWRMKNDLTYKIKNYLRMRIYEALKGINKSKKTMDLIGCSIEYLKDYLESQFDDEMSWGNYGFYGWHIDHIIPCDLFDLSKEEEQRRCFNYSNLQPLWGKDNFSKGRYIRQVKI